MSRRNPHPLHLVGKRTGAGFAVDLGFPLILRRRRRMERKRKHRRGSSFPNAPGLRPAPRVRLALYRCGGSGQGRWGIRRASEVAGLVQQRCEGRHGRLWRSAKRRLAGPRLASRFHPTGRAAILMQIECVPVEGRVSCFSRSRRSPPRRARCGTGPAATGAGVGMVAGPGSGPARPLEGPGSAVEGGQAAEVVARRSESRGEPAPAEGGQCPILVAGGAHPVKGLAPEPSPPNSSPPSPENSYHQGSLRSPKVPE